MNIIIKNCNNIDYGKLELHEGHLNIKYAINGTGKTTIAKAIDAFVKEDNEKKKQLVPFKYIGGESGNDPELEGCESIKSISIFDESYIDNYVFQQNDLLKDSFEIFIKTENYDRHIREIDGFLRTISETFNSHPELDELISVFQQFLNGFGKAQNGISKASAIAKGLGKGNTIKNIPEGLSAYTPYLQSESNVSWIKWQLDGKKYLDMAEQCPYCSAPIENTKATILRIGETYNSKDIEHLNNMLRIFHQLMPYFSEYTSSKIEEISRNVSSITDIQKNFLIEIRQQVYNLLNQLNNLKRIGFYTLRTADRVADEISNYKIDLTYYSHLNSSVTNEKIDMINDKLDEVLRVAGQLQGEIAQQKNEIRRTIENYHIEINDFLQYAGYKYRISIEEEDERYHLLLKHIDIEGTIPMVNEHLSYGERNALALVLFMYNSLKDNPDLVVLDDPISSFDGNKKFAIINKLFMGNHCLRNRTVLLLTHDFSTVIDAIYNLPFNFNPAPKASFLSILNGHLREKVITKQDIKSFSEIALTNIHSDIDNLNKLIYLRRYMEIQKKNELSWQLLSNIFHKREKPLYQSPIHEDRPMRQDEIDSAVQDIKVYIPDFDYGLEFQKTQDMDKLKVIYQNSKSNYEKLQIYRIMFNENNANSVIKKFVNETFHIENDYLFQVNPCDYETIPQYIIDECDKDVLRDD